jgi:hypothetical protein
MHTYIFTFFIFLYIFKIRFSIIRLQKYRRKSHLQLSCWVSNGLSSPLACSVRAAKWSGVLKVAPHFVNISCWLENGPTCGQKFKFLINLSFPWYLFLFLNTNFIKKLRYKFRQVIEYQIYFFSLLPFLSNLPFETFSHISFITTWLTECVPTFVILSESFFGVEMYFYWYFLSRDSTRK